MSSIFVEKRKKYEKGKTDCAIDGKSRTWEPESERNFCVLIAATEKITQYKCNSFAEYAKNNYRTEVR